MGKTILPQTHNKKYRQLVGYKDRMTDCACYDEKYENNCDATTNKNCNGCPFFCTSRDWNGGDFE